MIKSKDRSSIGAALLVLLGWVVASLVQLVLAASERVFALVYVVSPTKIFGFGKDNPLLAFVTPAINVRNLRRCNCTAANCREKVTGDDWRNPELWVRYRGYFSPYLQRRIDRLRHG